MPRVDKVPEPYDNQIKLIHFFREKTKSVQFEQNTAGGLRDRMRASPNVLRTSPVCRVEEGKKHPFTSPHSGQFAKTSFQDKG